MKKREFSIRYKILILMTVIPMLALGIYVVLALKVFKDDKIAYVFDSSSNMSSSIANQLKTQLNAVLSVSSTLFQDYLLQGEFTELSKKLFNNESQIEAIVAFKKGSQDQALVKASVLEKNPGLFDMYIQKWGPQSSQLFEYALKQKKRLVKNITHDDRLMIIETLSNQARNEDYVFVILYRASEMKEIFAQNNSMQALLVDSQGLVIFGADDFEGDNLKNQIPMGFLKEASQKISQGAESVRDSAGRELLTSFSKVGFSDLVVVTFVDQSKALSAAQLLVRKSFIFFIVMVSFIAIISLLASRTLTQALTSLFKATEKVSEGQFDFRVNVQSNDEIGSLADNFNLMAAEVSRLLAQTAENARMENELQTAKTVQETLFPVTKSKIGPLSISGFYEPASECGGDWWHYCQIGDKVFLWIGDATGHGAPAALITSAARSASSIIERLDVMPAQALELLNQCIYDVSKGQIMMTFFLAAFDLKTSVLTYSNASHEAPFLIRNSQDPLKKKDLLALNEVKSPRLGQARDTKFQEVSVTLNPGDFVFFYTDGIEDIRNSKDERWGEREFIKTLVKSHQDFPKAEVSTSRFVETFQAYRQGTTLIDDVTFFVVKNESGSV